MCLISVWVFPGKRSHVCFWVQRLFNYLFNRYPLNSCYIWSTLEWKYWPFLRLSRICVKVGTTCLPSSGISHRELYIQNPKFIIKIANIYWMLTMCWHQVLYCITAFHWHNTSVRWTLLLLPLYRWTTWSSRNEVIKKNHIAMKCPNPWVPDSYPLCYLDLSWTISSVSSLGKQHWKMVKNLPWTLESFFSPSPS